MSDLLKKVLQKEGEKELAQTPGPAGTLEEQKQAQASTPAQQLGRIDVRTEALMTLLDPTPGQESVSSLVLERLDQQTEAILILAGTIEKISGALNAVLPLLQKRS